MSSWGFKVGMQEETIAKFENVYLGSQIRQGKDDLRGEPFSYSV